MPRTEPDESTDTDTADWHARVVKRSLRTATQRSIDRGSSLIRAAAKLLERSNGDGFTVQDVADEAGQSLRTLYQYFESKDDLLLAVFEEAMRTYARMIRKAIVDISDPLERLGGAIIAAVRMPEFSGTGVDRGLSRLRLKLREVEPELVARSQEPVTAVVRELVEAAMASGQLRTAEAGGDAGEATYLIMSLKAAFITSRTLGNDTAARVPSIPTLASFCLEGLGASLADGWFDTVSAKLRLPAPGGGRPRSGAKPAGGRAPAKSSAPTAG
jgi:AcrR family transcriptional regulator